MIHNPKNRVRSILKKIYGESAGEEILLRINAIVDKYKSQPAGQEPTASNMGLDHTDSILITYGDMLTDSGVLPLQTLSEFCNQHLAGVVSAIHILPFYPWSSDDGFSVIDYDRVDPSLGGWEHIERLSKDFRLMFDAVINHISAESSWFQGYLKGNPNYEETFIVPDENWDLSKVIRPRTTPLLTEFDTIQGRRKVWTTFSSDQVDLNYHNPNLLIKILEVLLSYAQHGAQFIRLDAIAFIWKESGTTCLHLPQAHLIVQLIRAVFDWAVPYMRIITETNVPHLENIAYFGNGKNEAQLVYNFALPPLLLHTFNTGNSKVLSEWAASLRTPSDQTTFFNFLASHDGIGLNPARGILSEEEIDALVACTRQHGGLINHKQNSDGSSSPYELNISWFDALNNPSSTQALSLQIDRFICSQAVMLSLPGLPGIYFHSLFGSRGWIEGVHILKHNRAINRQKLELGGFLQDLNSSGSLRSQIFSRFSSLLQSRSSHPAFNPFGNYQILDCGPEIFGIIRYSKYPDQPAIICLHNITSRKVEVDIEKFVRKLMRREEGVWRDLVTGMMLPREKIKSLVLEPYQVSWLNH